MFSSIRAKFLIVLLPLFVVCFIVLTGISYYISNNALVDDADMLARATAGQAGKDLEKIMQENPCRMKYDDEAALKYGAAYYDNTPVIEKNGQEDSTRCR